MRTEPGAGAASGPVITDVRHLHFGIPSANRQQAKLYLRQAESGF